ncbi:tRNA pseudouridine(55) synthase TruB [Xylella fastidiosa subsp. sandyi]|uniref:tRNA pseudouridine(55) synthase TruB n=1 Tax=Xylella fastidiosa TaxID=2371 RepID=UPI0007071FC9|nr:tRNA pseudouridine(55) synthase TruB [Xylella fastidiosa]KQH73860.1 tRNA pseudouridine synthase B [Xylella fastidiosa]RWA44820.1 tRNA pseudouridine(55) synthase TruB [Xylella fastidiosa subsp. sandyi]WNY19266.1 tRNA pseudouridine(55) synthase TruB [Xylella fastidiosa]WNY21553.1 tRNA pseudouridine(55) synthase TruB [Xylella fastidiosa]
MSRISYRRLDGILLLDKPAGISSNSALQVARRLLRAKKGGHTGSLDPLATGLLPLCFGEATKIAGLLLDSTKAYDADVLLGTTTTTDDAEGAVLLTRPVPTLDAEMVDALIPQLIGRIRQRAPIYSALKQGGEPLYAKARRGEVVNAPVREVEVHAIELLVLATPRLQLRVTCGSGTYIRSLVRDLGEILGCGAHITALRRRWVAPFQIPKMLTLDALEQALSAGRDPDSLLLPLVEGLAGFPALELDAQRLACFRLGQRLRDHSFQTGRVAVFSRDGIPAGLGEVDSEGLLVPQRLFNL